MQVYLRPYATSGTIDFTLYDTNGANILTTATFVSGCAYLCKDEGTSAYSENLPTIGTGEFSLRYTASEIAAKRIFFGIVDPSSTKGWLDTSFVVETYGTSASQHPNIGNVAPVVEGLTLMEVFEDMIALTQGKILKNGDIYTYYKQDNTTVAFILSAGSNGRIKLG